MAVTPLLYLLVLLPLALTFSSQPIEAYNMPETGTPTDIPNKPTTPDMGATTGASPGYAGGTISGALTGMELIQAACKTTLNRELCESKIKADPRSQKADLKGLATIMLEAANSTASAILEHIASLHKGGKASSFGDKCLVACSEYYADAVDQLDDSLGAMKSDGYNDVMTWVTAAMTDASTCQDEFKSKPGYESPLTSQNQEFKSLCSIVLAITKHLSAPA